LLSPRFSRRPNCREFWAKKSVGDFVRGKENFLIIRSKTNFFIILI